MDEEDTGRAERVLYGGRRPEHRVYVGAEAGLLRLQVSGDQVGRATLVHGAPVRDVAPTAEGPVVATDDAVLVPAADGPRASGFGPAVAVGRQGRRPLAVGPEGRVARYRRGEWRELGSVTPPVAVTGRFVAAADGVFEVGPRLASLGRTDGLDVTRRGQELLAATADGCYRYADRGWTAIATGPHDAVVAVRDRLVVARDGDLYRRARSGWEPVARPGETPVVALAGLGTDALCALTREGSLLVSAPAERRPDGCRGWRPHPTGVRQPTALSAGGAARADQP